VSATGRDVPGVIAPPPLIFLAFLLAGLGIDYAFSLAHLRWYVGVGLMALAALLMALGVSAFRRAGTPVPTREPTTTLVTTGIHGLSRNPLYVSLYLFYSGIAIAANSIAALVLVVPLAIVIRHGVVAREEVYLERKFGDAYRAYKSRVPRWL
jgi:protein-S-isoprenylcysteine O-methyltransferase Ste14